MLCPNYPQIGNIKNNTLFSFLSVVASYCVNAAGERLCLEAGSLRA
jgi:hypothetical protein